MNAAKIIEGDPQCDGGTMVLQPLTVGVRQPSKRRRARTTAGSLLNHIHENSSFDWRYVRRSVACPSWTLSAAAHHATINPDSLNSVSGSTDSTANTTHGCAATGGLASAVGECHLDAAAFK